MFIALCASVVLALFCGCSSTQEMKDGISFADIKTFYVDQPTGADRVFYSLGSREPLDAVVVAKITEKMKAEGYVPAADRKSAAHTSVQKTAFVFPKVMCYFTTMFTIFIGT